MTEEINETTQYLTFKLADEIFAINVSQVREVLDITSITHVPRAPEFMRGVINVRGSVVPVVDLRKKFEMSKTEITVDSRIVVMELLLDGDQTILGAMADSVHDVIDLETENIEAPPKIGSRWRTEFIKGIGKDNDEFIIILDIERIFSTDELAIIHETGSSQDERVDEQSIAA
jgi:purine-binding chemotaxis protein CheW